MRRLALIVAASGLCLGVAGNFALAQDAASPSKTTSASPPPNPAPPQDAAAPPPTATPAPATTDEPDIAAPAPKAAAPKPPEPPKPPPEPLKRPRFNVAIMQGVDKITAETLRFEAKVGEPVRYKGLILTVHTCETTALDEAITDSVAHIEVQSQPEVLPGRAAAPPRRVFQGWMFASSPTLHPFEHPVYDLWLIACKTT